MASVCLHTVTLSVTVDNIVYVYRESSVVLSDLHWETSHTVTLASTCVLAVQGVDQGGGYVGILASTSTGVVSDASWKCSAVWQNGWHLSGFDDAAWAQARIVATNGVAPWGPVPAISSHAKWIWAQGSYGGTVYCRRTLC